MTSAQIITTNPISIVDPNSAFAFMGFTGEGSTEESFLVLEDGSYLLQEDGSKIII